MRAHAGLDPLVPDNRPTGPAVEPQRGGASLRPHRHSATGSSQFDGSVEHRSADPEAAEVLGCHHATQPPGRLLQRARPRPWFRQYGRGPDDNTAPERCDELSPRRRWSVAGKGTVRAQDRTLQGTHLRALRGTNNQLHGPQTRSRATISAAQPDTCRSVRMDSRVWEA